MTATNDRRMQILEILIVRKSETMNRLAEELGVSRMTVFRDIQVLSCSYPITTNVGVGGGVHIDDRYRLGMKYLSDEQAELLERLSETLEGNCLVIMLDILKTFRRPTV